MRVKWQNNNYFLQLKTLENFSASRNIMLHRCHFWEEHAHAENVFSIYYFKILFIALELSFEKVMIQA